VNSGDGRPPFNDDIVRRPGRAASERGKLRHFQHDGQITRIRQAPKSKIFRFTGILIYGIQLAIPRPSEGRFAVVTKRWAWDAMDAVASGDLHRTKTSQRTAKSCGPGAATLALRWWAYLTDNGGKKGRFPGESTYKP
jgi:hypothetical protein